MSILKSTHTGIYNLPITEAELRKIGFRIYWSRDNSSYGETFWEFEKYTITETHWFRWQTVEYTINIKGKSPLLNDTAIITIGDIYEYIEKHKNRKV